MLSTALVLASAGAALAAPARAPRGLNKRAVNGPVINQDFADPGLMRDGDGTWYAYSTSSSSGTIPWASSTDFENWSIGGDALPDSGSWTDGGGIWAPDVREISSGNYVMYYTGFSTSDNNHCIGAATATSPKGPFTPQASPIICNSDAGGVIDASGFQAPGGALYVLWKVDGNSKGQSTPIFIQPVGADGYTLQGSATQLISNDAADGGVTEAPSMVYWDSWYYLFFSSNVYSTLNYDISYAVSQSATGPFTKVQAPDAPFAVSGDWGTAGPGGATVINVLDQYVNMAFHSDINGQNSDGGRAMWVIDNLCLNAGVATAC